jgi:flavodoxin
MGKSLILYYSLEGSTEKIASSLAKKIGADIERVKPIKDIPNKGFSRYLLGGFQVISKKRPKLNPLKLNPNDYDTIIIGSPIWASNITPAISSLLESNLLNKKNIAVFYTFKGGDKDAGIKIKKCVEKNNSLLSILPCLSVETDLKNQQKKVYEWAEKLIM